MVVAVEIQITATVELEAGFGIAFGVELDELHPVCCQECHKGNIVGLCHRVVDGNEMLVFHLFDCNAVILIGIFCLQGRQSNATTANEDIPHSSDDVTANGTNIEF